MYMTFCVILDSLEDHQSRNAQEYLCLTAFYLFLEIRVLLTHRLNINTELYYLLLMGLVNQEFFAQRPWCLVKFDDLDQFLIVLQLWVHSIHIFSIFLKEQPEALDWRSYFVRQNLDWLGLANKEIIGNFFSSSKNGHINEVISTLATHVAHGINLRELRHQLFSLGIVITIIEQISSSQIGIILKLLEFLVYFDGIYNESTRVTFNDHQLIHIILLIHSPSNIEIAQTRFQLILFLLILRILCPNLFH